MNEVDYAYCRYEACAKKTHASDSETKIDSARGNEVLALQYSTNVQHLECRNGFQDSHNSRCD